MRAGTPFLPADPTHFANFLAEAAAGARGNTQSEQRACAIAALSTLAGVPSPADDALVRDVRAGLLLPAGGRAPAGRAPLGPEAGARAGHALPGDPRVRRPAGRHGGPD